MRNLEVSVATDDDLDVRSFTVGSAISDVFTVWINALSRNASVDFDAIVGAPARFTINVVPATDNPNETSSVPLAAPMIWEGVVSSIDQSETDESGLTAYTVVISPTLWLLKQRRNYRMFQQMSELEIALKLLSEWRIEPELRLDQGAHKKRKYKIQYAESDFDFLRRMLEEAGVTFFFRQDGEATRLVLSDEPQAAAARTPALPYVRTPNHGGARTEYVTAIRPEGRVRPGRYTIRDIDHRRPAGTNLSATAEGGLSEEQRLEQYHYLPGAFLFRAEAGGDTPVADDKGTARTDEREGARLAENRLRAKRAKARPFILVTNALDLSPGTVVSFLGHGSAPHGDTKKHLVLESRLDGGHDSYWGMTCIAVHADVAYRPPLVSPRPSIQGVESATVVGPGGGEIHTDELGRVRVHFHWDRDSQMDDNSSCWIPVSQPAAGAGYGAISLPRVGHEVLVGFLGGDPDRPVVTGRVYTNLQKTPYKLPESKTQSGMRSQSTGEDGGYNEILFEDKAGKELLAMRAERDLTLLVNHSSAEKLGASRSSETGRDDTEKVDASRRTAVGGDREQRVLGRADHTSSEGFTWLSERGDTAFMTPDGSFYGSGERIKLEAEGTLELSCGGSQIIMTSSSIIINSPDVSTNPKVRLASGGG